MDNGVSDFSHLQKLRVNKVATAEYELVELEGNPVLVGVFAGEGNKKFYNAILKRTNRNARIRGTKSKNLGRDVKDNREHDRELFPECVLKSWNRVLDSSGQEATFSQANCEAFLDALPDYIFDDLRAFFSNPVNFVEDESGLSAEDVEDLGNSSAPDSGGIFATSETVGQSKSD